MKQHKLFQQCMAAILFCSLFVGCSTHFPQDTFSLTPIDSTQTLEPTFTPTVSNIPFPSGTPSPRPTVTPTPVPAWVTDFVEPILAAIADRSPDYEEDFSQVGPYWYLVTGENCPDNGCTLSDGALSVVALPGNSHGGWVEQPLGSCCLGYKSFVMQVDVDLSNLQGENTASIWYTANIYEGNKFTTKFQFNFELKKDLRWSIWLDPPGDVVDLGQLNRSPQLPIVFTLISRDAKLAVYINDIPVSFLENPGEQYQPGFELCAWSDGISASKVRFDNARVWNLDNVAGLP